MAILIPAYSSSSDRKGRKTDYDEVTLLQSSVLLTICQADCWRIRDTKFSDTLLSTMTTPDGNAIAIPDLYENVVPPTPEDEELIQQLARTFDEAVWKEEWDVPCFVEDLSGEALLRRYFFSPSLNIDGLWAGYVGSGTLTVIPHEASCKLDFRLVPNMRVDEIVSKLKAHLDRYSYEDIQIRVRAAYEWSKTKQVVGIPQ